MRQALFIALLCLPALIAQEELELKLDDGAPKSLRWKTRELGADLSFHVRRVVLKDEAGNLEEIVNPKASRTVASKELPRVQQSFDWAEITTLYSINGNSLDLEISIESLQKRAISEIELDAMSLKLPKKPAGWEWPHLATNIDEPGIVFADCGDLKIACCNEDFFRPLRVGFGTALDADKKTWQIEVDTGRRKNAPTFFPFIDRPIFPGTSDTFKISLRFGDKDTTRASLAADVIEKYRKALPLELKWPDRRPIAALFIASSEKHSDSNPRGWLLDPTIDVRSEDGRAKLKERLLKYADDSIAEMRKTDAQGMILWDGEGQEFPHATSYIGDPRWHPPEIEPILDEFYKKFKDAGFKIGCCIRPQMPVRPAYNDKVFQMDMRDIQGTLKAKIEAAKKRWGCTLFYIDSNIEDDARGRVVHSAEIYRNLAKAFPDILLIPEHEYTRHYAYTAPYNEVRGGYFSTPADIRDVYPDAFSVLYVADAPVDENKAALIEAVKRGDILLFRGWWNDPVNETVREIYKAAGKAPSNK